MAGDELGAELSQADQTPPKRARGGQRGNLSAFKHGLRSQQFAQGRVSGKCGYIARMVRQGTQATEQEVLDVKGEIRLLDAAYISAAATHERNRLLAVRWLRLEGDKLDVQDRVAMLERIGKFADLRNAALAKLGIDRRESDSPLAQLQRAWAAADKLAAIEETKEAAPSQNAHSEATGALDGASTNAESET